MLHRGGMREILMWLWLFARRNDPVPIAAGPTAVVLTGAHFDAVRHPFFKFGRRFPARCCRDVGAITTKEQTRSSHDELRAARGTLVWACNGRRGAPPGFRSLC
jgi:hypothetical protein